MKKILLITEASEFNRYRIKRILEEAQKINVEVELLDSKKIAFCVEDVYSENGIINFQDYTAIYSIGNSDRHHYLIMLAAEKGNDRAWPSKNHLLMNDKFYEGIFLSGLGIKIPKTILLSSKEKEDIDRLVDEVNGYPCVIKKVTGSEGCFVGLVESSEDVLKFLNKMPHPSISGKKGIILQEYIKESKGTDFRVYCVGDEILGAIKRTSQGDDFRANVSLGGKAEKVELTEEMIEYSKKIMKEGKLLFAGIDFIKGKDGFLVIEINTSADFHGFEKATGINVAGKIIENFLK